MSPAPAWRQQELMLQRVAVALGPELLAQTAFVGGCTTALMVTDAVSREAVRFTDDVDLIVHVLGGADWYALQARLQARGFGVSPEDEVICRMRLAAGGVSPLIVDFMPDDETILGFSNRWYADALRTARPHSLPDGTVIRLVTPVYFVATKLEAFQGRGNNDPLGSRDIEDLLTVLDGRETLSAELAAADPGLQQVIAGQLTALLAHPDFEYAVQSTVRGNAQREALLFRRLEAIIALA
jgi:predicted nucleotidyltransferase